MRKHRQKIIFGAVRGLDRILLLFDCGLDATALGNCGRDCHCRDRECRCPPLQHQERLIFGLHDERTKIVKRSPNGDGRQDKDTGGGFALRESERGPDDNWSADK